MPGAATRRRHPLVELAAQARTRRPFPGLNSRAAARLARRDHPAVAAVVATAATAEPEARRQRLPLAAQAVAVAVTAATAAVHRLRTAVVVVAMAATAATEPHPGLAAVVAMAYPAMAEVPDRPEVSRQAAGITLLAVTVFASSSTRGLSLYENNADS